MEQSANRDHGVETLQARPEDTSAAQHKSGTNMNDPKALGLSKLNINVIKQWSGGGGWHYVDYFCVAHTL